MTKELLLSIQPQHLYNILVGNKTLELRKSVPKDFVGWVYLYCTKAKPYLSEEKQLQLYGTPFKTKHFLDNNKIDFTKYTKILNGKVVARFWYNDYIAYELTNHSYSSKRIKDFGYHGKEVLNRLCLTRDDFYNYGKGKDLYAWHIKKLEIFDEPKELSEFYSDYSLVGEGNFSEENFKPIEWKLEKVTLKRAPQSYQFVYIKEENNE